MKIFRTTLSKYGIDDEDKVLVRKIAGRAEAGLLEYGVPKKDLAGVFAHWDQIAQEQVPSVPLYPGAAQFLSALHAKGKKLALITATVRPVIEKMLDKHNLAQTFDVVVTGDEVIAHKPDPEGLLLALEKLGVPPGRALMLGDSEKDIRAAHNAGMDSVLFYPPEHETLHTLTALQADSPTYIIHSWAEMLQQAQ